MKTIQLDWMMKPMIDGEEMAIDQKTTIAYNNINAVSTITVPQEVIDNAYLIE